MKILQYLKEHRIINDGGMGTLLQANGLKPGELPETWNVLHPDVLVKLHKEYLSAGANILSTNTFGANRIKYPPDGNYDLRRLIAAAVENARQAREEFADEFRAVNGCDPEPCFIGFDIGPTGKLLKPLGDLDFEEAVRAFGEAAKAGAEAGADFIFIETMSDTYEVKAAVLGAKENTDLPVFATMTFLENGKLLTGADVDSAVALLEGLRVDALGLNCGLGPAQMEKTARRLIEVSSTPVIITPNAGMPKTVNGSTSYELDADTFASEMLPIAEAGACVLGGCCGTTPEHIRKMKALVKDLDYRFPENKNRTVVSSYGEAVLIGPKPVLIGERINPTGKKKLKEALQEGRFDYILSEAVKEQENGADVLDVNVGLPGIDEPAMMEKAVREIQAVTDLPLQIDTSDIKAMERALRAYNGKALINSVNGKEECMNAVFPMAAKYGGVIVALPLDENGIPDSADARIEIAEKIFRKAESYGIRRNELLIDGLVMTVSAVSQGALTTLSTVRKIKSKLHGKSILGVSNVSFGLPQREIINSAFFTMALHDGLNAAIMNPNNEAMMRAYRSFLALSDLDPQCAGYISVYGGTAQEGLGETRKTGDLKTTGDISADGAEKGGSSLSADILHGMRDAAAEAAAEELKTREPLEIISGELIPALNQVGQDFEKGRAFLPQLLMSAEAAKAAFDAIKGKIAKKDSTGAAKGTVILATVRGDVHDIGKNIVKVLMESYNYEVIDMGKDVPPEDILEMTLKRHVRLIGLSALMTTTIPSMEATIRLIHEKAPFAKVAVGGAVMTKEYADAIHADSYSRDAMGTVRYADGLFA
jgi:5-methyltetrahydrofolate--homocysteine methyltransferase